MEKTEQDEVNELKELFGSSPTRESNLPVGAYSRFTVQFDNNQAAKKFREEKDARKQTREAETEARKAKAAELVQADRSTIVQIRQVRAHKKGVKLKAKREQRALEAQWELTRNQRQEEYEAMARDRVIEGKSADARMDKAEAKQD